MRPSNERRDGRDKLAWVHWFGEMQFEPASQRFGPIFRARERRERRRGDIASRRIRRGPHARDELESIHVRHAEVDNQHVWFHVIDARECRGC